MSVASVQLQHTGGLAGKAAVLLKQVVLQMGAKSRGGGGFFN